MVAHDVKVYVVTKVYHTTHVSYVWCSSALFQSYLHLGKENTDFMCCACSFW